MRKELMSRFNVKKVAVLGAGVMGAQIAAHLADAGYALADPRIRLGGRGR